MRSLQLCFTGCGLALLLAGCNSSSVPQPGTAEEPPVPKLVTPIVESPATGVSKLETTSPITSKLTQPTVPPLPYPTDLGGQAVSNALAPVPSTPAPLFMPQVSPKPRLSSIERGELPLPKVAAKIIPLPAGKASSSKPSPPLERINPDLGQGVTIDPRQYTLASSPVQFRSVPQTPKLGADDLPVLSRRVDDRASLEDPTSELSTARIVNTPVPRPMIQVGFLKLTIPDPFELLEQLRGSLGTTQEFAEKPVIVAPAK
jgi:hypothetical protein